MRVLTRHRLTQKNMLKNYPVRAQSAGSYQSTGGSPAFQAFQLPQRRQGLARWHNALWCTNHWRWAAVGWPQCGSNNRVWTQAAQAARTKEGRQGAPTPDMCSGPTPALHSICTTLAEPLRPAALAAHASGADPGMRDPPLLPPPPRPSAPSPGGVRAAACPPRTP